MQDGYLQNVVVADLRRLLDDASAALATGDLSKTEALLQQVRTRLG